MASVSSNSSKFPVPVVVFHMPQGRRRVHCFPLFSLPYFPPTRLRGKSRDGPIRPDAKVIKIVADFNPAISTTFLVICALSGGVGRVDAIQQTHLPGLSGSNSGKTELQSGCQSTPGQAASKRRWGACVGGALCIVARGTPRAVCPSPRAGRP